MLNTKWQDDFPALGIGMLILAACAAVILVLLPFLPELALSSGPGVKIDSDFQVPSLPMESPYRPTANIVLTWTWATFGMIAVVFALIDSIKRATAVPVMLTLSAIGICIPEVFVDLMGCVWYATTPDDNPYTILGRRMPWFIIAGWFGFAGVFLHYLYSQFRKGVSERALWGLFLVAGLTSVPLEEILLHFGMYYYYGNQPLVLFAKYPFWWMPCNAGGVFLAAALAYRFEAQLQGWRSLAILLITPMSVAGMYGFIAMPSWIVVNGNYSWLVTQAAGLLTVIMGFFAVALVIKLVVSPRAVAEESARTGESGPAAPSPGARPR